MIRVGIVQLDTSHCEYFTPVVNDFEDLKVTAVWDDGWVRAPGYAEEFAREFDVEKVCASLDELVDSVDVGMLFGQNWDLHLEQARPFLEAGKRVFIDKPVVGSMRDVVVALRELSERTGVPVMGGSSLRYAPGAGRAARASRGIGPDRFCLRLRTTRLFSTTVSTP